VGLFVNNCGGLFAAAAMLSRGRSAMEKTIRQKRSAGIIIVRQMNGAWRFLLLRSFRNWDFPKGLIEPNETPLAAALRETEEETGLSGLVFTWGEQWRETEPYARGKIARFYVACSPEGEVTLPVNAELGVPEHHEFRWLTFEAALKLLPPRLIEVLRWANEVVSK
jgi:bis(5'-nucleosidyl)-tetraphosphatase